MWRIHLVLKKKLFVQFALCLRLSVHVLDLVKACEAVTFKIAFRKINFLSDENRTWNSNEYSRVAVRSRCPSQTKRDNTLTEIEFLTILGFLTYRSNFPKKKPHVYKHFPSITLQSWMSLIWRRLHWLPTAGGCRSLCDTGLCLTTAILSVSTFNKGREAAF